MSDSDTTTIALACQGGGSHTAYIAGVLAELAPVIDVGNGSVGDGSDRDSSSDGSDRDGTDTSNGRTDRGYRLTGVSGTSGGASCALLWWYGLLTSGPERARTLLERFWTRTAARSPLDAITNDAAVGTVTLENSGVPVPDVSPYASPASAYARTRLRNLLTDLIDFERVPDLAARSRSSLHVGAVDVVPGVPRVFRSGAVTVDAILASAAIPTLFPAVTIDNRTYWDGLFAANPPIADLLSSPKENTPDELWIVSVNPRARADVPRGLREIADRRSELSANLSIAKDVAFIEQVNEWPAAGYLPESEYKHVDVRFLDLDRDLSLASKLNRDPDFLDGLIAAGRRDAAAFLADGRDG